MSLTTAKTRRIRGRLEAHRFALLARYRAELERADEELAARAAEPVEAASEQWDARVLSLMSEMDARALESVTAALRRLDDGTYGVCTGCGDRIEPKRLDALPEAAACRECVSAREQTPRPWVFSVAMSR
jgi:RNA polymerase-binding transcription factor DksA